MKDEIIKSVLMVMLALLGGSLSLAQVADLEKPTANLTEKWDTNSSGWVASDAKSGWTNGAIAINCPLLGEGDYLPTTYMLKAVNGASGNIFQGDYSKIESVSFEVQPNEIHAKPRFYFVSANSGKRTWKFPFLDTYINGQKSNISIPFVYSANWSTQIGSTSLENFNIDKTNVSEIGFIFTRQADYRMVQQFAVDNLKLVGPWSGPFSNGVSLAWVMESGLTNDFGSAGIADNDGDGFSNAAEFLAGTDPVNSNSFFKIEIARNEAGKMVVKWNGNRDVNYEVREANSLGSDGIFVTKTNIATSAVKAEEVEVDNSDSNSKFFKVVISQK
ncbi:MAG: thrombospondin type 3 repeat-containing protein [bacterium]|jgi:hypothetical protein